MGYMLHAAMIADYPSLADAKLGGHWKDDRNEADAKLAEFKQSMPSDKWRALVVGPVDAITNGYAWLAFLPDGSKEGWDDSDLGDELRGKFIDLFGAAVVVHWGDEPAYVVEGKDDDDE